MPKLKPIPFLIAFHVLFSMLQSYLITKISWIGRVGIHFFYKEYTILRSGWKTFILFFSIQVVVIGILWWIRHKYSRKANLISSAIFLLLGLIGLLYTYNDFQNTYTHRLLKERFHLGFYLFWMGWLLNCLYFAIWGKKSEVGRDENSSDLKISQFENLKMKGNAVDSKSL